ncbi:hypothetical protein GCM10028864_44990 [Microlunatus parietis]
MLAGPLLLAVVVVDGTIRSGYDRVRHGVSQLGTGQQGWPVQITFVVCGALFAWFAVVIGRTLRAPGGSVWVPRWFGVLALGLVLAGIAPTDPALGFPPGLPEPATMTPAAVVHQVGGGLMFAGLIGGGIAAGRWFRRAGRRAWGWFSLGSAIIVAGTATAAGVVYRLIQRGVVGTGPAGLLELVSFVVGFGWAAAFAVSVSRWHRSRSTTSPVQLEPDPAAHREDGEHDHEQGDDAELGR